MRAEYSATAWPPDTTGEKPRAATPARRHVLTILRVVVSALLIAWILRGTDITAILRSVRAVSVPILALAFSLHFIGYFITALRWKTLLRAQGVEAELTFLMKSYLVALFFSNFLPSTMGGDAIRAYDSWRLSRDKAGALTVVFVDRFTGLVALLGFALAALLLVPTLAADLPLLRLALPLVALGIFAITWLLFVVGPRRIFSLAPTIHRKLPFSNSVRKITETMSRAFDAFNDQRGAVGKALALSVLLQTNVVFQYYLIGQAMGFTVPIHAFFLFVPLALVVMMAPISINAIGIRESVFAFFLAIFGIASSDAVAFAWLAYGFVVVQGVLGGILYATRK